MPPAPLYSSSEGNVYSDSSLNTGNFSTAQSQGNNVQNGYTVTPGSSTGPAPIVVNSSQAETALNGAANNVQTYNTNNQNQTPAVTPPTPSTTTPPSSTSAPTTGTGSTTTPPTSSSQPSSGYYSYTDPTTQKVSYYDSNGDPVTSLPQGVTPTSLNDMTSGTGFPTAPNAPTFAPTNATGTSDQVSGINSTITGNLASITAAGTAGITALGNFLNGSMTLTPSQQSLINATLQSYQYLMGLQLKANSAQTGAIAEANARNGLYTPSQNADDLHQAISDGLLRLAGIQSQQATAVSTMQEGFEKEDFQMVLDANSAYVTAQNDVNTTLNSIADRIQSSIQFNQTFQQTAQQDQFTDQMASTNLTLTEKQDAFSNYMGQQNLTLAQKTLAEKTWADQQNIAIQNAQLALAQGTFDMTWDVSGSGGDLLSSDVGTAGGTTSGSTVTNTNPAVGTKNGVPVDASGNPTQGNGRPQNADGSQPVGNITYNPAKGGFYDSNGNQVTGSALSAMQNNGGVNGIKIYDDGLAFYDESAFAGSPQATAFLNSARNANVTPLAPADAQIVTNLEAAKNDVSIMAKYFTQTAPPSNVLGAPVSQATRFVSGLYGGATSQAEAKYNAAAQDYYNIISTLSESKRANGQEFGVVAGSVPNIGTWNLDPSLSGNGLASFQEIQTSLNNHLQAFIPGFNAQPDPNTIDFNATASALAGTSSNGGSTVPTSNSDFLNASTQ